MKDGRIKILRTVVFLVICVLCLTGCHKNDGTGQPTPTEIPESGTDCFNVLSYAPFGNGTEKAD